MRQCFDVSIWCWLQVPQRHIFWDNTSPYILQIQPKYSHTLGSGQRDDDAGEREG